MLSRLTWAQGGLANVVSMVLYLVDALVAPGSLQQQPSKQGGAQQQGAAAAVAIAPPVETPPLGCLHPRYQGGRAYFTSPAQYWAWCVVRAGGGEARGAE